jgi:hypothetical protein
MKQRHLLAGALLGLALAAAASAQQEIKDLFRGWEKTVAGIREKEREEFARIAAEWRQETERLRPFWLMLEAETLQGENQFRAAAGKAEEVVRAFEQREFDRLTSAERVAYREALLQLGRLCAVMGEQEQAFLRGDQAWKLQKTILPSSQPGAAAEQRDAMRTALAVGFVLLGSDRQDEAAGPVNWVLDTARRLPEPLNRPDSNPFLAEACLLKSILANSAGNYPAARTDAERALACYRKHYPRDTHPDGDPKLAVVLVKSACPPTPSSTTP